MSFAGSGSMSGKLDRYSRGFTYQISENVVWSLNCPRYHPNMWYNADAGWKIDSSAMYVVSLPSTSGIWTLPSRVGGLLWTLGQRRPFIRLLGRRKTIIRDTMFHVSRVTLAAACEA